ncbi:MAG: response regulator, partial [Euryarchaeota archaeon]|nr:response regulator [Euryarchaeota archaeon]MBV1767810.1 response regulator [Methanobacterium sp.]
MGKASILVVEDEAITALDINEKLVKLGYNVLNLVLTGKEAIKFLAEYRPDLVLMDINLKGKMDGTEAAQKISSLSIPVVFLSAYSDNKTLEKVKKSAPYGYMVKPFDTNNLQVTIETALKKHQADVQEMYDAITTSEEETLKGDEKEDLPAPPPRILIVEDEFITAMDLEDKLKDMGYQVVDMVASGDKALEKIRLHQPDLILMDLMLQGDMDGAEVARKIAPEHIPVIFLTAYADENTIKKILETSPYGYLIKPFKSDELHSAIEVALEKSQADKKKKEKM